MSGFLGRTRARSYPVVVGVCFLSELGVALAALGYHVRRSRPPSIGIGVFSTRADPESLRSGASTRPPSSSPTARNTITSPELSVLYDAAPRRWASIDAPLCSRWRGWSLISAGFAAATLLRGLADLRSSPRRSSCRSTRHRCKTRTQSRARQEPDRGPSPAPSRARRVERAAHAAAPRVHRGVWPNDQSASSGTALLCEIEMVSRGVLALRRSCFVPLVAACCPPQVRCGESLTRREEGAGGGAQLLAYRGPLSIETLPTTAVSPRRGVSPSAWSAAARTRAPSGACGSARVERIEASSSRRSAPPRLPDGSRGRLARSPCNRQNRSMGRNPLRVCR